MEEKKEEQKFLEEYMSRLVFDKNEVNNQNLYVILKSWYDLFQKNMTEINKMSKDNPFRIRLNNIGKLALLFDSLRGSQKIEGLPSLKEMFEKGEKEKIEASIKVFEEERDEFIQSINSLFEEVDKRKENSFEEKFSGYLSEEIKKETTQQEKSKKIKFEDLQKSKNAKKKKIIKITSAILGIALIFEVAKTTLNGKVYQGPTTTESFETVEQITDKQDLESQVEDLKTGEDNKEGKTTEEVVDPDATEEDINNFTNALETQCGKIMEYYIIDGSLYCFAGNDINLSLYKLELTENEGFKKQSQINNIIARIDKISEFATIKSDKNYLIYKSKKYNLNAIKGQNVFAEKIGVKTGEIVTSVSINKTENGAYVDIFVLADNKFVKGRISTTFEGNLSDEKIIDQILSEKVDDNEVEKVMFGYDAYNELGFPEVPEKISNEKGLYFQDLEDKIKSELDGFISGFEISKVVAYSMSNNGLRLIVQGDNNGEIIYKLSATLPGTYDLSDQESIDKLAENFSKDWLEKDVKEDRILREYFTLDDEDVEIEGIKYSKSGIYGDNAFARKCGVNNALVTYYRENKENKNGNVEILVLYEEDGSFIYSKNIFRVVSDQSTKTKLYEDYLSKGELKVKAKSKIGELIGGEGIPFDTVTKKEDLIKQ